MLIKISGTEVLKNKSIKKFRKIQETGEFYNKKLRKIFFQKKKKLYKVLLYPLLNAYISS